MVTTIVLGLLFLAFIVSLLLGIYGICQFIRRRLFATVFKESITGSMMSTLVDKSDKSVAAMTGSLTTRAVLIGVLAMLMLVPLALVEDIVYERGNRYSSVLDDIARTWGGAQTVMGPILVVPFTEVNTIQQTLTESDGTSKVIDKTVRTEHEARFLPDELDIKVRIVDEVRERGIFKSLVYSAELDMVASIDALEMASLSNRIETVHWDKAWLSIGLSDTRAIKEVSLFEWNGESTVLSPGTRLFEIPSGFHANLPDIESDKSHIVKVSLNVAGSGSFNFSPFGESTRVSMQSLWPHPSFQGDSLPDKHTITEEGFTASWDIPHLARNYPQAWVAGSNEIDVQEFVAGVSMFEPVSLYSQVTRSVKYGILFIGLTFLTLLIVEIAMKRRMHIVQYALIGVSLCLFFLVLLSLSEHIAFARAYTAAAALTIAMIASYTGVVLGSAIRGSGVALLLISLYAVLFSLLQLEDYALLVGTGLLVVVVIVLMIVTRNIRLNENEIENENENISDTLGIGQ